ncbi:hypothetical protein ANN_04900 [Periplaneta americana]|uniref:Uncharacterized protein n=1 Tax=Periplaneta americana TaxID=6978 RepID=A0ABQ8T9K7_PERAM|nr:hypothetical protein ANN_04900 [Periplaneta americana]
MVGLCEGGNEPPGSLTAIFEELSDPWRGASKAGISPGAPVPLWHPNKPPSSSHLIAGVALTNLLCRTMGNYSVGKLVYTTGFIWQKQTLRLVLLSLGSSQSCLALVTYASTPLGACAYAFSSRCREPGHLDFDECGMKTLQETDAEESIMDIVEARGLKWLVHILRMPDRWPKTGWIPPRRRWTGRSRKSWSEMMMAAMREKGLKVEEA